MKRTGKATLSLCAAALVIAPAFASAQSGGMLRTMPHGVYECALPGDATGGAWKPLQDQTFTLGGASSYTSAMGRGTYLLTGKEFTFTRGPRKGERYVRVSENQLRKLEKDGSESRLLCVRSRLAD